MVKPGYKQTEIGLIPADWTTSKLGNIGQFKNGINKDKDKFGYGVPIIGLMEIFGVNHINSVANSGLVDATLFEQEDYSVKEGDVLFVRSSVKPAGVGLAAVVENDLQSAVFSGFLLRYRTTTLTTGFKRYAFYAPYFRENLIAASTVSANTNINQDSLKQLVLAYPESEHEQNTIGEVLSDVDAFIADLERLIAKKKAIKQGAMQELLTGKKRLPGFSGEWQTIPLTNALTVGHGMSQHNVESPTGKYPILATGGEIGKATTYLWDKPSVLIGRKGTINKPQYMDRPFWSIDTLFYTKIKEGYYPKFLYYVFCQIDWLSYNEASGVPSLSAKTIESIEVQVPEYTEQIAIAELLSEMDSENESLEQKLAKYRQLKQGMMQQLLTGKIRLV